MKLQDIRKEYRLIDFFVELVDISSPPKKEKQLSDRIIETLGIFGIKAKYDNYENLIIKIPPSPGYKHAEPLLLTAHMDVVGGLDKVNVRLSEDGKYIETDKTRTLGADDKVGIAAIMDMLINLRSLDNKTPHGPLEIAFTRDEEFSMSGIKSLDTSQINSEYAIVIDGEKLGKHATEGAGFINLYVSVTNGKGGHSGIDISDKTRINAIKVLTELDTKIPQGVYRENPQKGVISSINAGVIMGGSCNNFISDTIEECCALCKKKKQIPDKYNSLNILNTINTNSSLNIINTDAYIAYSIRSSRSGDEQELIDIIKNQVELLNSKYEGMIKIETAVKRNVFPFKVEDNNLLSNAIIKAGKVNQINCDLETFHAGAETHVLAAEKKNSSNKPFKPILLGIADIENMHSAEEKVDWKSFIAGRKWLEDIISLFAQQSLNKG